MKKRAILTVVLGCFCLYSCKTYLTKSTPRSFLVLGDSNGAAKDGWVNNLKVLMPQDSFYNYSIPGNTIGFDNLNNENLNTLKSLEKIRKSIIDKQVFISDFLIMLGTNDAKNIFAKEEQKVPNNLEILIDKIRSNFSTLDKIKIWIISPPPYGPEEILESKYFGGGLRVKYFASEFKKISSLKGCNFVNIYDVLLPDIKLLTRDGIHFNEKGYKIISNLIYNEIK
jgi:hypothetical protein